MSVIGITLSVCFVVFVCMTFWKLGNLLADFTGYVIDHEDDYKKHEEVKRWIDEVKRRTDKTKRCGTCTKFARIEDGDNGVCLRMDKVVTPDEFICGGVFYSEAHTDLKTKKGEIK